MWNIGQIVFIQNFLIMVRKIWYIHFWGEIKKNVWRFIFVKQEQIIMHSANMRFDSKFRNSKKTKDD